MRRKMVLMLMITLTFTLSGCQLLKDNGEKVFYGTAEMEQINISAEANGVLKEIKTAEGTQISKDAVIAVINSPESAIRNQQAELGVQNASNELEKINIGAREEEIAIQKAMVNQLSSQKIAAENAQKQGQEAIKQASVLLKQAEINSEAAEETYLFKKKTYEDNLALYQSGSLSKQELDTAEYNMNMAQKAYSTSAAALESAKAQLLSSKAQLEILQAQKESMAQQLEAANQRLLILTRGAVQTAKTSAELGVKQAESNYELSKLALEKTEIKSAIDGIVNTINYDIGEYVLGGTPIATISNPSNVWVKIYVPEKLLPQLKLNQEVMISSDFIKESKTGKITNIATEAEYTPMNIITKEDRERLVYAVKVQVQDDKNEIKAGMLLDVRLK